MKNFLLEIVDFWNDGAYTKFLSVLVIIVIISIPFMIRSIAQAEQRWQIFKHEHNCKIVAHNRTPTTVGVGTDGQTVIITGTTTTSYLCDDGITYTR